MRKTLTAKLIQNLRPRCDRRYEIRDTTLPGFGVRVHVNGKLTWFVVARIDRRQVRRTLGHYPIVTLSEAREAARLVLKDIQLGDYAPRNAAPQGTIPTLGSTIDNFIELHAKVKNRGWKSTRATLRKFHDLNERPITEISRADVVRILDRIVASGAPIAANRAMSAIKKVFAWALDRGRITVHPLIGLQKPSPESSRERVLADSELAVLWSVTKKMRFPFGPLVQLLILTGQRRGEVANMRWSQIDFESPTWTIPSEIAKNGRTHRVPLSDEAVKIIRSCPRFINSDLIFTTTGTSSVSGFGRMKSRIDSELKIPDWRIHDLRRTAASGMARLGTPPHIIEKVLNHVSGEISGVAAIYNRHGYKDEKSAALTKWSDHISKILTHENSTGLHRSTSSGR